MKYIILIMSLIILTIKVHSQCDQDLILYTYTTNLCDSNPWVLVFEDSFNGNSLDVSRWGYGPRIRYCNDEQQYLRTAIISKSVMEH